MKLASRLFLLFVLVLTPPALAQKPTQASSGSCSPNISSSGSGNVTLQFIGNACQGIDPAALKKLNDFLATFPKQQKRLLELLDVRDTQLDKKVQEIAELTMKYQESTSRLEALGRPEHMAKMAQLNAISDKDREALSGTIHELEGVLAATHFQPTPENLIRLGWSSILTAQYDKALAFFLDATKQNPSLGSAYLGLATAYHIKGHEFLEQGDLDSGEEALAKSEGNAKIAGQYDELDSASIELLGYSEAALANVYSDKGQRERAAVARDNAARHFNMLLGADPQNPGAHNGLGILYLQKVDLDAAIREFQSAVSLQSKYTFAWFDLVLALRRKYDSPGQSQEQNAATLRSLIESLKSLLELTQDSTAQQLTSRDAQAAIQYAQWAAAEAAKYRQPN